MTPRQLERRHSGVGHWQFGNHSWSCPTQEQAEQKVKNILEREPYTDEEKVALAELAKEGAKK